MPRATMPTSTLAAGPSYAYHFVASDLAAIDGCLDDHGFAIVRGVVPKDLVRDLEDDVWREVDPARTMAPGESRYSMDFIEHAPAMWRLLAHEPYMRLCRGMLGDVDLVIHRSAAILRLPGS